MKSFWKQCEGQAVDGFALRQYLGGGDNHGVFLTEHGSEPRRAAIKLIYAGPSTNEDQLRRWRIASELSHPNLLRVFERGLWQIEGVPVLYLVMEYADEDLSQVIPERALTAAEVRELLSPALDALAYLHGKGLAHGHLKPSNFMAVGNQLKLSADGIVEAGASGAADDVWSLGVSLVEILTQRRPVWTESDPSDPALPETLPREFRDIAQNSLRRNPDSRWTVVQIQQRLRTRRVLGRKQVFAAAIGFVLILLAMVAGTTLIRQRETAPVAPSPQSQSGAQPAEPAAKPSPMVPAPKQEPKQEVTPTPAPPPTPPPESTAPAVEPKAEAPAKSTAPVPSAGGDVVHRVMPELYPHARNSIRGKVVVAIRVNVDASGTVTDARYETRGPSVYFAGAALKAARQWKFGPADGPRAWILRFVFTRGDTKVTSERAAR
jgi:TonB family protein